MNHEKEQLINQLNDILKDKTFSDPVKDRIKNTISRAYDCYSKEKDKKEHFEQIIQSLSVVNTFKINTRKQLNKNEKISQHLSNCALGFVTCDNSLVAITKEGNEDNTIYHELIHLTQSECSYHLDRKYPFSSFITKCLKEGEASYYDMDLLNKSDYKNCEVLKNIQEGEDLTLSANSSYPFYEMVYETLLNIFGQSIMEKWKKIDSKTDIMPLLEEEFKKKYDTSFENFYIIFTKMIYLYFKNLNSIYYDTEKEINQFKKKKSILKARISLFKEVKDFLTNLTKQMEEIKAILGNDSLLKQSLNQRLEKEKKELQEYMQESDYDEEVAETWQNDIDSVSISYYKEILQKELNELKKEFTGQKIEYDQLLKEIIKQQYCMIDPNFYLSEDYSFYQCYHIISSFAPKESINDFCIYTVPKKQKK